MEVDVQQEYHRLKERWNWMEELVKNRGRGLLEPVPSLSAWSPAQHLYHLAVATGMMLKGIRLHVEAQHPYALADGEPSIVGRYVLSRGCMVRGKAQAPEGTHPPVDLSLEELRQSLARSRSRLEAIEPHLPILSSLTERSPHPFFGALTPAEWLRVARIHTEHHIAIVEDLLRTCTPPQ